MLIMNYMKKTVIGALAIFLFACSSEKNSEATYSISDQWPEEKRAEFELIVSEKIKEYTQASHDSTHVSLGVDHVFVSEELTRVYNDVDNRRLWSEEKNRHDLIKIIKGSYYDGLNPEDYHIKAIQQLYLEGGQDIESEAIRLARIDVLMTDAIMLYAFHMIQGKVNPESLDPNWNYSKRDIPDDIELKLISRLEEQSLADSIKVLRPAIPMYNRYRKWFAHYDSLQNNDGKIAQLEYPGEPLKLGDSSSLVTELKKHLENFDVSGVSNDDGYFDETLEATLIDFQTHFGLTADGVAGESTFEALNTSIQERMNMIRVNMERCRWIYNMPPREFLLVNIADFHLYIFRDAVIDYTSRVVVGKEHHETPIFTSNIQYVVFNPTWTVPYSIATKETLPRLKQDPDYLSNRNMTLLRNGKEIDPYSVDFSKYSVNNFPFTIRQEPGVYNALGRMKFIFPNKYSVYLHDTPSKSYFEKSERTFSHGCVRVQNPHLLAEQLLGDKGYDQEKIKEVLKTEKETNVHLENKMPVLLMYWTCYENHENGKMYFYKDVYNRDKVILDELLKNKQI
jgi:murein L,D-transpeptidase YcbB/YkuD